MPFMQLQEIHYVGDEIHFLFICKALHQDRAKCLPEAVDALQSTLTSNTTLHHVNIKS